MHMEMMHSLSSYFAIVLHDIQALAASLFLYRFRNVGCKRKYLACSLLIKLVDIIVVLLRQNQRMSLIGWCQIQNYTALWCLIYRCRWNLSICDLAENTIIFFIFTYSFYFNYLYFTISDKAWHRFALRPGIHVFRSLHPVYSRSGFLSHR